MCRGSGNHEPVSAASPPPLSQRPSFHLEDRGLRARADRCHRLGARLVSSLVRWCWRFLLLLLSAAPCHAKVLTRKRASSFSSWSRRVLSLSASDPRRGYGSHRLLAWFPLWSLGQLKRMSVFDEVLVAPGVGGMFFRCWIAPDFFWARLVVPSVLDMVCWFVNIYRVTRVRLIFMDPNKSISLFEHIPRWYKQVARPSPFAIELSDYFPSCFEHLNYLTTLCNATVWLIVMKSFLGFPILLFSWYSLFGQILRSQTRPPAAPIPPLVPNGARGSGTLHIDLLAQWCYEVQVPFLFDSQKRWGAIGLQFRCTPSFHTKLPCNKSKKEALSTSMQIASPVFRREPNICIFSLRVWKFHTGFPWFLVLSLLSMNRTFNILPGFVACLNYWWWFLVDLRGLQVDRTGTLLHEWLSHSTALLVPLHLLLIFGPR